MVIFENQLIKRQVETLYRNLPSIVFFVCFATTAVAGTLIVKFPAPTLLFWAAYMYVVSLMRYIFAKQFKSTVLTEANLKFWLYWFLFFSILTGMGSGFLTYYYFSLDNIVYSVFVFLTYIGFLSAGALSNSIYLPAFFAYSLPPTIMSLLALLGNEDPAMSILAILVAIYYVVLLVFARNSNQAFIENALWDMERNSLVGELRQQKETAEQAIKAKSNFFAAASHDLRQPLHALGLFNDALRHRIHDPESTEILDKISSSTQALNELLHGMLDISRLDASVIENCPKNIHLLGSLNLVHQEFYERAYEKELKLIFNIDEEIYVNIDSTLCERVIRNLVDNAIKYTDHGFVKVTAEKLEGFVVLKIEDSGIGIPKDQLENVFTEFGQLANPERDKQKGLGLGLSIVRRLCKLMGVKIALSSTFGSGTAVSLWLPLGEQTENNEIDRVRTLTQGNSQVLVVEDDRAVMDGMKLFLETLGFYVSTAEDAQQAIHLSKKNIPDLIIADYRLPGDIDGLGLLDIIREYHDTYIPAILVTGETAPDTIQEIKSANVMVLHKPVESELLEDKINEVLYPSISQ